MNKENPVFDYPHLVYGSAFIIHAQAIGNVENLKNIIPKNLVHQYYEKEWFFFWENKIRGPYQWKDKRDKSIEINWYWPDFPKYTEKSMMALMSHFKRVKENKKTKILSLQINQTLDSGFVFFSWQKNWGLNRKRQWILPLNSFVKEQFLLRESQKYFHPLSPRELKNSPDLFSFFPDNLQKDLLKAEKIKIMGLSPSQISSLKYQEHLFILKKKVLIDNGSNTIQIKEQPCVSILLLQEKIDSQMQKELDDLSKLFKKNPLIKEFNVIEKEQSNDLMFLGWLVKHSDIIHCIGHRGGEEFYRRLNLVKQILRNSSKAPKLVVFSCCGPLEDDLVDLFFERGSKCLIRFDGEVDSEILANIFKYFYWNFLNRKIEVSELILRIRNYFKGKNSVWYHIHQNGEIITALKK